MQFDLKVGFTCNNDCIHCVITDKKQAGDLSTEQIKDIILNDSERDSLVITGGEATIRRDFLEILKFSKEEAKVNRLFLQTNGRAFADKNFAESAAKYIDVALIAIHSHNELIHDSITQRKNSWKQTIKGIENLLSIDENKVQSQTVISKVNCDNLFKTYEFMDKLGIKSSNVTYAHAMGNAKKNINISQPRYSSIKEQLQKIFEKFGRKLYVEMIPQCVTHPYVLEDEKYHSYNLNNNKEDNRHKGIDISNARGEFFDERGIIENYNKSLISEMRKPEYCIECIYDKKCMGVWKEYYQLYEGSLNLDLIPVRR